MVTVIRKPTKLEKLLRLRFGKLDDCGDGYTILGKTVGSSCVWVPKDIAGDHILCPSKFLDEIILFAQYLEKELEIRDISIKET
jgi:hypothetical protein